jgi:hypothetical protein
MFLVPVSRTSSELSRNLDRMFDDSLFDRFFGALLNFKWVAGHEG